MNTDIRGALDQAIGRLGERADVEALLLYLLGKPRSWLFAHADDPLGVPAQTAFAELLTRREGGEPVAYITGSRGFWSMDLQVNQATLIPRPETELLVEQALQRLPRDEVCDVADLGTGCGAVALALAQERPMARVFATDASAAALAVAQRNASRLGLGHIAFLRGDWLAPIALQRFVMIVSNPPYIESADVHLQQGDLRFEPLTALASGIDGLDDIRRIIHDARDCLQLGGWLLLEHGWQQGKAVRQLLSEADYTQVFTARDLESRDRVSGARKS